MQVDRGQKARLARRIATVLLVIFIAGGHWLVECVPMVGAGVSVDEYICYRNPLENTYLKLAKGEEVNIVYFGGSVTQGYGANPADNRYNSSGQLITPGKSWRALTEAKSIACFPKTQKYAI